LRGLDGEDLRLLPLNPRKAKLARLLARPPAGIVFNEHTDEDGAVVFRHARKLGFEGIVSKRLTAPYRSGPSRNWIAKTKAPAQGANLGGALALQHEDRSLQWDRAQTPTSLLGWLKFGPCFYCG
jgi:bifunctional non-homologous end joining protein LigD